MIGGYFQRPRRSSISYMRNTFFPLHDESVKARRAQIEDLTMRSLSLRAVRTAIKRIDKLARVLELRSIAEVWTSRSDETMAT